MLKHKLSSYIDPIAIWAGLLTLGLYLITSLAFYAQSVVTVNTMIDQKLLSTAKLASQLTNAETHQGLKRPEDKWGSDYQRQLQPYMEILKADRDLIYIYTVVKCPEGLCFVMDAGLARPIEKLDTTQIMQTYKAPTALFKRAFAAQKTTVENKPYKTQFGHFLSAYAPIHTMDGQFVGMVGVDMRYGDYLARIKALSQSHLNGLVLAGLLSLGIVILVTLIRRRHAVIDGQYRSIMSHIPAVVYEAKIEEQIRFYFVNPQIEALTGLGSKTLTRDQGLAFSDLILSEDRENVIDSIRDQLAKHERFEVSFRLVKAQKLDEALSHEARTIWVGMDGHIKPKTHKDDFIVEGFIQDISERKQAELKLINSEKHFRTLADALPNKLWITDVYGESVFYNSRWLSYTGQSMEEGIEQGWLSRIHPDDKDFCLQKFIKALETESAFECWFRLLDIDGDYRWMLCVCNPRFNDDGGCNGFICTATDITERKQFETRLKLYGQQMEMFFKYTPASIAVFDADMKFVMVTERWKSDFHAVNRDLIAQSFSETFPTLSKQWRKHLKKCLSGMSISNEQDVYIDNEGREEWLQWELQPWSEDGQIKGVFLFTEIITERKRIESEIKHHRDNLQTLVEEQTGALRLESEKNILLRNIITSANCADDMTLALEHCLNEICHFTGWTLGTCRLVEADSDHMSATGAWNEAAHTTHAGFIHDMDGLQVSLDDGSALPVKTYKSGKVQMMNGVLESDNAHWSRIMVGNGIQSHICLPLRVDSNIIGVFDFFIDHDVEADPETFALIEQIGLQIGQVIERFQQNERLRIAKEAAEASAMAKSEFLSNMSHELRTPMHAILNYADMGLKRLGKLNPSPDDNQSALMSADERGRLDKYLNNIGTAGSRLLGLLNSLLDLAKMESGKMTYHFADHTLRSVIEPSVMELDSLIKAKALSLDLKLEAGDLATRMDHGKLIQVVINLMSNAIKFTKDSSRLCIETKTLINKLGHEELVFSLSDEGKGIPEDELAHIFEAFVQSRSTKSGAGGTGLGLSICQQIIEAHKGRIWAENRYDDAGAILGAKFCFVIPQLSASQESTNTLPIQSLSA